MAAKARAAERASSGNEGAGGLGPECCRDRPSPTSSEQAHEACCCGAPAASDLDGEDDEPTASRPLFFFSRTFFNPHRHVRRPCSRPLQEQVPQGDLRPITCIPWVDWQLEESLRVGPHGCERCQGRPTTRQGPSSGDLRPRGPRSAADPREAAEERKRARAEATPYLKAEDDEATSAPPPQLQFRVRALLTPGSLFQREPWPRVCAGPRLPVASDRADQRGVHRNLRPLPQRQAVGHHLDPPAIRRRRVEVEVPKGDAGGHPCSGLTANARRSPFKGPRSLREHPDLSTRRSVVPEFIKGPPAAAAARGEWQRQAQPPQEKNSELPIVDHEVWAARDDDGERAARTFAALGQQQRSGMMTRSQRGVGGGGFEIGGPPISGSGWGGGGR